MRIAVNRKALEINKRLSDVSQHHPPIVVAYDDGTVEELYSFSIGGEFKVVYSPEETWSANGMTYNVWIEFLDRL